MGSELDLSGRDLRHESFRGRDLRGAKLHGADLRGTDFSGADLRGADLSGARLGMGRAWQALVFALALALSLALGVVAGGVGKWLTFLMRAADPHRRFIGVFLSVELGLFLAVTVWKGLDVAARQVLPVAIAIAFVVAIVAVVTGAGPGTGAFIVLAFSVLLMGVVVFTVLARALAGGESTVLFVIVAMSGALSGSIRGGGLYASAIAIAGVLAARRSMAGKHSPRVERTSLTFASAGGTRFRNADLRDASFEWARVRNTDFRGAALDGARFEHAQVDLCLLDRGRDLPRHSREHPDDN